MRVCACVCTSMSSLGFRRTWVDVCTCECVCVCVCVCVGRRVRVCAGGRVTWGPQESDDTTEAEFARSLFKSSRSRVGRMTAVAPWDHDVMGTAVAPAAVG